MGSVIGMPFRAFYSASKGAVDLMTEALRLEIEHFGIKACTVHPGDVKTNISANRIISTSIEDEAYGKIIKPVFDEFEGKIDHGKNPQVFGPFIEKILKSKRVKRNYYIGSFDEILGINLKKFLPYFFYEKILRFYFKAK